MCCRGGRRRRRRFAVFAVGAGGVLMSRRSVRCSCQGKMRRTSKLAGLEWAGPVQAQDHPIMGRVDSGLGLGLGSPSGQLNWC
ncbi:hypothetical protein NL676_004466 [Syzygium grande]|nr:hypothetical protein NL676_004466 [Syzygium grande]